MNGKYCILDEKFCNYCQECLMCDLESNKKCDNCCTCLDEASKDYEIITIDRIITSDDNIH